MSYTNATANVILSTVNLNGMCRTCGQDVRRTINYSEDTGTATAIGPWYHVRSGEEECSSR